MIRPTGGCSSVFSPLSGFADRLAKTPSLVGRGPVAPALAIDGVKTGSSVTLLSIPIGRASSIELPSAVLVGSGFPRINLCLSSPSFSASESSPSSNVSASVCSASVLRGSVASRCRDEGDDVLDRKDGGGEEGAGTFEVGVMGVSSSS